IKPHRRELVAILECRDRLLATIGTVESGNDAPTDNWSRRLDGMGDLGIGGHHETPVKWDCSVPFWDCSTRSTRFSGIDNGAALGFGDWSRSGGRFLFTSPAHSG